MFDLQSNLAFAALQSFPYPSCTNYQQSSYAQQGEQINYWNYSSYPDSTPQFRLDGLGDILLASISNNITPNLSQDTPKIKVEENRVRYQRNREDRPKHQLKYYYTTTNNNNRDSSSSKNQFTLKKDSIFKRKQQIIQNGKYKYQKLNQDQKYYDNPKPFCDTPIPTPTKQNIKHKIYYKASYRPSPTHQAIPRRVAPKSKQKIKGISASQMDLLLS